VLDAITTQLSMTRPNADECTKAAATEHLPRLFDPPLPDARLRVDRYDVAGCNVTLTLTVTVRFLEDGTAPTVAAILQTLAESEGIQIITVDDPDWVPISQYLRAQAAKGDYRQVAFGSSLALAVASLIWLRWRCRRWRRVTIFLSYRVASDQALAEELYNRLLALGLRVWWDKKCLKPGQPWEDGFADGLFSSSILVPVLSKGALATFATLTPDSPCDNVLLEHLLALEQHQRGKLKAIFPVFVGEPIDGSSKLSNFFETGGMPARNDAVVASVDEKAIEHLRRRYGAKGAKLRVVSRSPHSVLQTLCKHQGGFIRDEPRQALSQLVLVVRSMAQDVAAGETFAEASELVHGCARPLPLSRRRTSFLSIWLCSRSSRSQSSGASRGTPTVRLHPTSISPPRSTIVPPPSTSTARDDIKLTRMFAPHNVLTPEEETQSAANETVVSVVMKHEAHLHGHRAQGALRVLDPVLRALSPRSQLKKTLAAIDHAEGVRAPLTPPERGVRTKDKKSCKRLRQMNQDKWQCEQQVIDHRRDVRHLDERHRAELAGSWSAAGSSASCSSLSTASSSCGTEYSSHI